MRSVDGPPACGPTTPIPSRGRHPGSTPGERNEPRRSATSGVHPGRTGDAFTPGSGAHDLAGADARGARVDPATVAGGDQRPHGLDVRVPTARRAAVRVRHRHTETGPLATYIAHGSHGGSLPENRSRI